MKINNYKMHKKYKNRVILILIFVILVAALLEILRLAKYTTLYSTSYADTVSYARCTGAACH